MDLRPFLVLYSLAKDKDVFMVAMRGPVFIFVVDSWITLVRFNGNDDLLTRGARTRVCCVFAIIV